MYTLDEQVHLVQMRVKQIRRKQENRLLAGLSALCMVLTTSLVGTFAMLSGDGGGTVPGLYGATMMFEGAGGYVLVGLLAFGLAVAITVLCIRHKEKTKETTNQRRTRRNETR